MGKKDGGQTKKIGGRRKRDEMSSLSGENSQETPEAKRTDKAAIAEDDVCNETSENTASGGETRRYSQDPAIAAIWEAVVRIEANTNLLINEHKALKTQFDELQKSLQFTQADVVEMKKENQKLKDAIKSTNEKNNKLEKKLDQLENNLQSNIEQRNSLEKKLDEAIKMHDN